MKKIFRINGAIYKLPVNKIPNDSLLEAYSSSLTLNDGEIQNIDIPYSRNRVKRVFDHLNNQEKVCKEKDISLIEYLSIPFFHSYHLACLREDTMRCLFSSIEEGRMMHGFMTYDLIHLDEKLYDELYNSSSHDSNSMLWFSMKDLLSWSEMQYRLGVLKQFSHPSIIIAGGSIFCCLTDNPINDIDCFLLASSREEGYGIIEEIVNSLVQYSIEYVRTINAITLHIRISNTTVCKVQIILRLYRTPSEILHGFDIDCCSLGYWKDKLWITSRALISLKNRVNRVNFNRLSPSYEYRLIKYANRGFGISIPNFDRRKIVSSVICDGVERKHLDLIIYSYLTRADDNKISDYEDTSAGCTLCVDHLVFTHSLKRIWKIESPRWQDMTIPKHIYDDLSREYDMGVTRKIHFIKSKYDKMTCTFNVLELNNLSDWYQTSLMSM